MHSCPRAAAPVRPPGNREQERADTEDLRHRRGQRAEQRGDREPSPGREHRGGRVDPFGKLRQSDPCAEYHERGCGQVGGGEQPWPLAGVPVVEPPAGRKDRARRDGGRDLGAVPPREAGQEHRDGHRERAVDDHDRLQASPAGTAGLPADLPVGTHDRRLGIAGAPTEPSSSRR